VSFASSPEMQSGKPFAALGMQIAAGVPLQCDEGPEYRSFRLGLFGLARKPALADTQPQLHELAA